VFSGLLCQPLLADVGGAAGSVYAGLGHTYYEGFPYRQGFSGSFAVRHG
jgi:hypothetical protein